MHPHFPRRRFLALVGTTPAWIGITTGCHTRRVPGSTHVSEILDTHTHFYDPARPQGLPWPPKEDALLHRTVMPANYLALPVPRQVTGTVVVEASPWVEDNQWVLDLADRTPFIEGFVGNLPVGTAEFAGLLDRFARHPRFRGIRIRDRKLDGALEERALLEDLRRLADRGLTLDLVGGIEILGFAEGLATRVPELRIVLDHLAGVRVDGGLPPSEWEQRMREVGRHARVYAKVSGLVEGTGRTDGTAPREVGFYRPVLDVMWQAFGPQRLLYGSNWPVSERFAPLATVQGIVQDYVQERGPQAETAVLAQTAREVYGLKRRA